MAWKPKEKELSPEEAIALARKELEPFWFRSEPLICGVSSEAGIQAVPLDTTFPKHPWLLFFIDPTEFSGETVMVYAKEWYRRYSTHEVGFLVMFRPPYRFYRERPVVNQFIEHFGLTFPVAIDADGLLTQAFRVHESLPKLVLLDGQKIVFEAAGKNWREDSELQIQKFLRSRDPGLALSPPFIPARALPEDRMRIEFGYGAPSERAAIFPGPWVDAPRGMKAAKFAGLRLDKMQPREIFLSGNWIQDAEKIATQDPQATLGLTVPSSRFSLVAQSLAGQDQLDSAKISVEVLDKPAYDAVAASHLTLDDSGLALVRVREANFYHVIHKLPVREREVTLRFPTADRQAVALYGIRYGE